MFLRSRRRAAQFSSIVVLLLEQLSGDPSQQYFADGITDAVITDLAKISTHRVISRTSAMHYRDRNLTVTQIAEQLGVDAVVEGSVTRSGNHAS
jgi:TolB-like protein